METAAFTSHIPDAPELAASICTTAPLRTLIHNEDFRLYRFSGAHGRYEVERLSYHVLSLQHASGSRVRAQVGEDRFCGIWERGTFDLRPASAPKRIGWTEPVDLTSIWLAPAFCARVLETTDFDVAPVFARRHPVVSEILSLLSHGADLDGPYGRLYREGLIISLIAELGTSYAAHRRTTVRCGLSPTRLRRVLDFIEEHVVDDISLAALAAQACVSERHFCTMFGIAMGRSPHRYLIERRVERAKLRLRADRSATITDVALSVGFRSSAHFATMFRKMVGVTPTAYRCES